MSQYNPGLAHVQALCHRLYHFQQNNLFCDVAIQHGETVIGLHSLILQSIESSDNNKHISANEEHTRDDTAEQTVEQSLTCLASLDKVMLSTVVRFLYTGELHLVGENIYDRTDELDIPSSVEYECKELIKVFNQLSSKHGTEACNWILQKESDSNNKENNQIRTPNTTKSTVQNCDKQIVAVSKESLTDVAGNKTDSAVLTEFLKFSSETIIDNGLKIISVSEVKAETLEISNKEDNFEEPNVPPLFTVSGCATPKFSNIADKHENFVLDESPSASIDACEVSHQHTMSSRGRKRKMKFDDFTFKKSKHTYIPSPAKADVAQKCDLQKTGKEILNAEIVPPKIISDSEYEPISVKSDKGQLTSRNAQRDKSAKKQNSREEVAIFECEETGCKYSCAKLAILRRHRQTTHAPQPSYVCEHCGKYFKSKSHCTVHRNAHYSNMFKCDQCEKSFKYAQSLSLHIARVHKKEDLCTLVCSECPFSTNQRTKLVFHMYKKHGTPIPKQYKSYECSICGYVTMKKTAFVEHEQRHTGLKLVECSQCQKLFHSSHELKVHMMWHKEKKHKCPEEGCDFAAILPYKLRDHIRLKHTNAGEKPFKCPYCSHCAAVKGNLTKHIHNVHRKHVDTHQHRITTINRHTGGHDVHRSHSSLDKAPLAAFKNSVISNSTDSTKITLKHGDNLQLQEPVTDIVEIQESLIGNTDEFYLSQDGCLISVDSESKATEVAMTLAQLAQRNTSQQDTDIMHNDEDKIYIVFDS